MLEMEIQTTRLLPSQTNLLRLESQKKKAEDLSVKMTLNGLDEYAARIDTCCDYLVLQTFLNGFAKVKSLRLCRVRGCPICEEVKARRMAGIISKKIKSNPLKFKYWTKISLPLEMVGVSGVRASLQEGGARIANILRKDEFRFVLGGVSILAVSRVGDFFLPSIEFYAALSHTAKGKYHVGAKEWGAAWGVKDLTVTHYDFRTSKRRGIDNFMSAFISSGQLDLLKLYGDDFPSLYKRPQLEEDWSI